MTDENWQPPPGHDKRWCASCRHWFAAPLASQETLCATCRVPSMHKGRVGRKRRRIIDPIAPRKPRLRPVFDTTPAGLKTNHRRAQP